MSRYLIKEGPLGRRDPPWRSQALRGARSQPVVTLILKMTYSTLTIKDKSYLNFLFSDLLIQDEVFTIFWKSPEEQSVPSELSAAGTKRGVRSVPMRTVPSRRSTSRPSRPSCSNDYRKCTNERPTPTGFITRYRCPRK